MTTGTRPRDLLVVAVGLAVAAVLVAVSDRDNTHLTRTYAETMTPLLLARLRAAGVL